MIYGLLTAKIRALSSKMILVLIVSSGFAALAWEVIWQVKSTLALGISAWGAALTLIVMMGGMGLGAFLMGNRLHQGLSLHPMRVYGVLEIIAGLSGLFLNFLFSTLEKLDTWAYGLMPSSIFLIYLLGITVIFFIPTLCIGATLPVFKLLSDEFDVSIAKFYSINTLGAAGSVLVVAFIVIPLFGFNHTIELVAAVNIAIGIFAWIFAPHRSSRITRKTDAEQQLFHPAFYKEIGIVFVTGFATFTLEIAWFRSLLDTFPNTTDIFAILLACMLIALGLASRDVVLLKPKKKLLGVYLCLAGILIFLMTPLIERVDTLFAYFKQQQAQEITNDLSSLANASWLLHPYIFTINWMAVFLYGVQILLRFFMIGILIIPPIRFLGRAFPWILDNQHCSQHIGILYAVNMLAAVLGAIGAAWFLLPMIGFAKTAWIAGIMIVVTGAALLSGRARFIWAVLGVVAFVIALFFETGIGKTRVQGFYATDHEGNPAKILGFYEGPEATISAVEYHDKARALLINSTAAAWESGKTIRPSIHYMAWMGHLPMLLHPNPKKALVICFGTGQTANAVRKENPDELDIVDVNATIFKLAHYFKSNEDVLEDPRVKTIVMDGRAYLRRSRKMYDVITLEPMPPNAAGVNALYSKEFYELVRNRLKSNGMIAQWLPFHILAPQYAASIARTFIDVFPNAILWLDQASKTGILLGMKENSPTLGTTWPGYLRRVIARDLTFPQVKNAIALDPIQLQQYGSYGRVINDDNQLLAYGKAVYVSNLFFNENLKLLRRINNRIIFSPVDRHFR